MVFLPIPNENTIKEITYDSYGNILKDTNQNFKVPFGFAGGLHDRDTNLVHFGYREYDPYTGKWTAKDPIDFSGGDSNLYGYVLQDPVNLVDPEGLKSMSEIKLDIWENFQNPNPNDTTKGAVDDAPCPWYFLGQCGQKKTKDLIDAIEKRRKQECEFLKQCGKSCE